MRDLQDSIGIPSMTEFIKIIENHLLINCPVSKDGTNIDEDIYVPNLGYLRGKTVRQLSIQVCDSVIPIALLISQK